MPRVVWTIVALSLVSPAAAAAQAPTSPSAPAVKVGGYVQGELDAGTPGDTRFPSSDRFFLRRARVTVSGTVSPSLAYRVQVELAGGLGAATGVKGELTDGYLEWTRLSAAHIRFGQFKAPFGREWLVPSTQLITVERTLASDRLTVNRQNGVEVLGANSAARLGYSVGVFNGNGRNTTVNDNRQFMYIARGTAVPWHSTGGSSLEVGANAYWSRDTALSMPADFGFDSTPGTPTADHLFTGRRTGLGLDAHVERGAWRVDAELLHVRFDQATGVTVPAIVSEGWYVSPAAFVWRRAVQLVGRYEWFRPALALGGDRTSTWLAGVNYYPRGGSAKLMVDDLWVDAPGDPGAHQKVLAQVQVVF